ncbi:MAG TPA: tyrosine-type recombinase/integrase [Hyphomonas sp.]|nr:tyrosine-type recombinase/integrase [Hyphomonas sp.]
MAIKDLTEFYIDNLRPPRSGRLEVKDKWTPGLTLRVGHTGAKTFACLYRVTGEGGRTPRGRPLKGELRRTTIGRWPMVGLAEAREEARRIAKEASEGRSPDGGPAPTTVAGAVESLLALAEKSVRTGTYENMERNLRLHVVPKLGERAISTVTTREVALLLDGLVIDGRAGTAREVRKALTRLFGHALGRGLVTRDPLASYRMEAPPAKKRAGRDMKVDEARQVYRRARARPYPRGSIEALLLLTGARKAEITDLTWDEVDLDACTITISAHRHKSNRDHVYPLTEPAMEIMRAVPRHKGSHVFTLTGGKKSFQGKLFTKESITPHDTRRTVTSIMAANGVPNELRKRVIGQATDVLDQIYNRHDYAEEKRAALELVAKALL